MAARPSLLADGEQAVHRTRHRATHDQQIALGIDVDNAQADLGEVAGAHMPGHPLALDDARRIRARRDRSRFAMARGAVRLGPTTEVVTVDDALETAALRHAAYLHAVAFGEDCNRDGAARRRCFARHREAPDDARSDLHAALLHVARERLGCAFRFLRAEAELRAPLGDRNDGARPGLDHRDGHMGAGSVEQPRHSQFSTDQSIHFQTPMFNGSCRGRSMLRPYIVTYYSTLISTSTPAGRSSFVNASTVWDRESTMSLSRFS